jgi:hypothetical protein
MRNYGGAREDDGTATIGDTAGCGVEMASILSVLVDGKDRNKTDARVGDKECVTQSHLFASCDLKFNGPHAYRIHAGTSESLDRVWCDGTEGLEVRAFGQDVERSTRIKNEGYILQA